MQTATLGQIRKILGLLEDVSSDQVQIALGNDSIRRALNGTHLVDFREFFDNLRSRNVSVSSRFCAQVVSKSHPRAMIPKTRRWYAPQEASVSDAQRLLISQAQLYQFPDESHACAAIAGIISRGDLADNRSGVLFIGESCVVVMSKVHTTLDIGLSDEYLPVLRHSQVFLPRMEDSPAIDERGRIARW